MKQKRTNEEYPPYVYLSSLSSFAEISSYKFHQSQIYRRRGAEITTVFLISTKV